MFKSLRDKLKGWMSKTKEEPVEEVKPAKKITKKETKKQSNTKTKKTSNKKNIPKKKEKFSKEILTPTTQVSEAHQPTGGREGVKTEEPQLEKETISSSPTSFETPKKEKTKKGFFSMFSSKLTEDKFEERFEELEMILMQNNIAYEAIQSIKEKLKEKLVGETSKVDIVQALSESIEELLINPPNFIEQIKNSLKERKDNNDSSPNSLEKQNKNQGGSFNEVENKRGLVKNQPYVILFAGINGAGKTTTIAKVAHLLLKNKLSVCLASADTFRAAAIEQLQAHADKLKIPLIKKDYGADPASVGFDAVKYAKKNKIDVVLIDTAGRMNNRDSLMKEIQKISKVNSPDMKIFLGESITGNDATQQAKDFNDAIGIDGIILSKADVDEKGGTAISVSHVTKTPIYFLGTGQKYDDLEVFDKDKLIEKLFG